MLSIEEIKRFIDDDMTSEKKQLAKVGQRYYEAEHDILQYRVFYWNADGNLEEDKTRSNIKISHPFFMILSVLMYMRGIFVLCALSFENKKSEPRLGFQNDQILLYFASSA